MEGVMPTGKEGIMGTKNILLVDDSATQLHLLSNLLRSEGFDVTAVSDGFKALEVLKTGTFRAMITDFQMPGMNGIELAALVNKQHDATRVVLVTASTLTGIIDEAASAGVFMIFSKPIDLKRLVAAIRSPQPAPQLHSACS
jgi:CheY-like chemotaxis protein